jgi:RNA-directed DNA polymerase
MSEPLATYEWGQVPWRKLEVAVFKLQRRIYRASQANDRKRVHKLQRLLVKSRAAKYLAVRRVTQDNHGKQTAGVDGITALTSGQRQQVVEQFDTLPTGQPARRVWIPKVGTTELRPLSIPTLYDRAHQALVKQALEPEWEAKFEPNSYGFRPGRSVHDAIGAAFIAINKQPKYCLDADIAKCFDRIDQTELVRKLQTFPRLSRPIRGWLKAGALDNGVFSATEAGTGQGSVLSPLLANVALHGMEDYLRSHFPLQKEIGPPGDRHAMRMNWKPQLIRFADDLILLHRDHAVIQQCQQLLTEWLQKLGLELHPTKTRIAHTLLPEGGKVGFDFLGFEIRQYPVSQYNAKQGFKTLIKPSRDAIKRHYAQLCAIIRKNQAAPQDQLIRQLNPVIVGWSKYYSAVISKASFQRLDHLLYLRLARWARFRHPHKGRRWIARKYWHIDEGLGWRFGTKTGPLLTHHAATPIMRHSKVKGTASPFDGDWRYWATRRGYYPGISRRVATLLRRQHGRCGYCDLVLLPEAFLEVHHRNQQHGDNSMRNLVAVHRHCHDQIHGRRRDQSYRERPYDKSRPA